MRIHDRALRVIGGGTAGLVALAIGFATTTLAATVPARGGPSFTGVQVAAGQHVYTQSCQGCHGARLEGLRGPPLLGADFLHNWAGGEHTASDIYDYISKGMPLGKPGSLSQTQYLSVLAYVLSQNGYQLGLKALTPATLNVTLALPEKTGGAP